MATRPAEAGQRRVALLVSGDPAWSLALAGRWAAAGDAVTLVLLDTAVTAARQGHVAAPELSAVMDGGVAVAAELRSLQRRGLRPGRLVDGAKVLDLDEVADLIAEGADKVLWL